MNLNLALTPHSSGPLAAFVEPATAAPMDNFTAVGIAEGWIAPEDEDQQIAAWQHLHDTGLAYSLQGWFGRTAQQLLAEGVIS